MTDDEIDGTVELDSSIPTKAPPAPEVEDEEDEAEDLDDGGPSEEEAETIEFEEGGKKYKVPAALKGHLLRQQDYSRNMNGLKVSKQQLEAERAEATKWRESEEAHQRNLGEFAFLEAQLKQYEKIDWPAWLAHADPNQRVRAQAAQAQMSLLERKRGQLRDTIQEGKAKHETAAKQATAERLRATRAFAESELPGWTPERDKAITELAVSAGVEPEVLLQNMSPAVYRLLDLALDGHRYRDARTKAKKAAKQAETAEVVQPLTRVATRKSGGNGRPTTSMSTADWIAARNKQVNAQAR